jgi:poly-gamma-glutamate capsule biosynthesis protein CapA/YwtB (metallophosphatase superfamily)
LSAGVEETARTLFLSGDVMTGRGVDQILGRPSDPALWERHIRDARDYVALAEGAGGPIPSPVAAEWIWGEALAELDRAAPDVRIVNLETSVTRSDDHWPRKQIHYRMHPDNIASLTAAGIDACVLANNHVLDFGYAGLEETVASLGRAGIATAGAGPDLEAARRPAVLGLGRKGRAVVVAAATLSSGVPPAWAATAGRPGVRLLLELSEAAADNLAATARAGGQPDDVVVASIHWGSNWGYEVPAAHVRFARWLVDAGVDVVYGHSSHHPRPIEIYRGRLILYGCGDLINDYEGIHGYGAFRGDLALLYLPTIQGGTGGLVKLRMVPVRIRRMRLERASPEDARWLRNMLRSTSGASASALVVDPDDGLVLSVG